MINEATGVALTTESIGEASVFTTGIKCESTASTPPKAMPKNIPAKTDPSERRQVSTKSFVPASAISLFATSCGMGRMTALPSAAAAIYHIPIQKAKQSRARKIRAAALLLLPVFVFLIFGKVILPSVKKYYFP